METIFKTSVQHIVTSSLTVVFFICILHADGQNRYSQKLYAYKEIRAVTNIFINDTTHAASAAGKTNYLIYIELPAGDTPIWHTAITGEETYAVHSSLIQENPLVIGERKSDKQLIKIKPQPHNRLWKLEFDLTGEKAPSGAGAAEGSVILKGYFKNKKITSTVSGIVELASP